MKPKTLDEALQLVPEYLLLRTGEDKLTFFDETYYGDGWGLVSQDEIGLAAWGCHRRPIPQHVREALARITSNAKNDEHLETDEWIVGRWLAGGE